MDIQSGDNCFDNAETLFNSYNGILECLVKIEEKLSTLRKTSKNKMNDIMQKPIVKMETKLDLDNSFKIEDSSDFSKYLYNQENTNCKMSDLSTRFTERLNDLYTHLVTRHIEEEKLLNKYFDTARSIREKNAINLTKNKLNTLRMRKSLYDDNIHLKKRQRVLLIRLQSEYNEIRFMTNFQKKLSEDRRRNLFRQLQHFKTVLSTERSGAGQQSDNYVFEIMPNSDEVQNHRKELNEILDLHLDLRKNVTALKTITHMQPHSQVVSNLKQLSTNCLPVSQKNNKLIAHRSDATSFGVVDLQIEQILSTNITDVFDLFITGNVDWRESHNSRSYLAKLFSTALYHYFNGYHGKNATVSIAKVKFRNLIEKIYVSQNQLCESYLSSEDRILCLFGTLLSLVEMLVGRKIVTFNSLRKLLLNNFKKVYERMDLLDPNNVIEALTLSIAQVKAQKKCTFVVESNKTLSSPMKEKNRTCNKLLNVRHNQEKHLREKIVSSTYMVYEELKKKQLAVEMEIKALLEQNSPMQYFLVREIPDKPPPPYIPPLEDLAKIVEATVKKDASEVDEGNQIERTVKMCFEHVWMPFLSNCYSSIDEADMQLIEVQSAVRSSKLSLIESIFLFDLCNELFALKYRDLNKKCNPWDYEYHSPSMRNNICRRIQSMAEQHLERAVFCKEDIFGSYAQKVQYHVDELLARELHTEEAEWVDIEEHVSTVKNMLTNTILNELIDDTVRECKYLY